MKDKYISNDLIFLLPYFDDQKIWGGTKLKEYGYNGISNIIGEAYLISALDNKSSLILNSNIKESELYCFYNNHPEWFNLYPHEYPLLTKLIDANDNLSVQVHPDNKYALSKFNKYGKYECWYILDCDANSRLVYGLKCNNLHELKKSIKNSDIENQINYLNIKKNDVIEINPGTVHSIQKGIFLFEIQQSSDLTFRLYDYNRVDNDNKPRKLHLNDCYNVIDFKSNNKIFNKEKGEIINNSIFSTIIYELNNEEIELVFDNVYWIELTILEFECGMINNFKMKKGISILIKDNFKFKINGTLKFALTLIKK